MPSLDVKLMTKNQDLSFQRHPGPEQEVQHRPDQAASFSHETEALRDTASRTSRIRFPAGTVGGRGVADIAVDHAEKAMIAALVSGDAVEIAHDRSWAPAGLGVGYYS